MKKFNLFLATLLLCVAMFCSCGSVEIGDSSIPQATTRAVLIDVNGDSVALEDTDSSSFVIDDSSIAETTTTTTKASTTTTTKKKTAATTTTTTTEVVTQKIIYDAAPAVEKTITCKQTEQTKAKPAQIEEFIVFKSSTHYVHKSTCRWANSECKKITDTENIKARKCTECNPDIEIKHLYKEPVKTTTTAAQSSSSSIDSYSRQLLAEIVWHEAGSNWITQYDKAHIAAAVMNRVYDKRFPSTVYDVLVAPGQFTGYWPGSCTPTQACYDAVDYYFAHSGEFDASNSWYGDGRQNHFYYQ